MGDGAIAYLKQGKYFNNLYEFIKQYRHINLLLVKFINSSSNESPEARSLFESTLLFL